MKSTKSCSWIMPIYDSFLASWIYLTWCARYEGDIFWKVPTISHFLMFCCQKYLSIFHPKEENDIPWSDVLLPEIFLHFSTLNFRSFPIKKLHIIIVLILKKIMEVLSSTKSFPKSALFFGKCFMSKQSTHVHKNHYLAGNTFLFAFY